MPRWELKTEKDYQDLALTKGFQWIGLLPEKTSIETQWICHCGNVFSASYKRVHDKAGYCQKCSPSRPRNASDYHGLALEKGIQWLGHTIPQNTKQKTQWKCSRGHEWKASYASVYHSPKSSCRECSVLRGKDNPNWNGGGGRVGAAHRRRAREAHVPCTFSEEGWKSALQYWQGKCVYCNAETEKTQITQDHFRPLSRGGGYIPRNIVPACLSCNSSKKDNSPEKWLVATFGEEEAKRIQVSIERYFDIIGADAQATAKKVRCQSQIGPTFVSKFDLPDWSIVQARCNDISKHATMCV